jgi:hypothetical protein
LFPQQKSAKETAPFGNGLHCSGIGLFSDLALGTRDTSSVLLRGCLRSGKAYTFRRNAIRIHARLGIGVSGVGHLR